MYTHRRYIISVRDGSSRYGDGAGRYPHGPLPSEEHPGARALRDLTLAAVEEIPRITARFAALRAWTLRWATADAVVVEHAVSAALAHLDAACGEWAEGSLLRAALCTRDTSEALSLLVSAADAAESLEHLHGAHALREAVHRARWDAARYPPPCPS